MFDELLPPQAIEAEQAILGSILIDNRAIETCLDIVVRDDFYREPHRKLYHSMLELFDRQEPIDLITVKDHLDAKGELEAVGGPIYIVKLANDIITAANIKAHAKIVREKSIRRLILQRCKEVMSNIHEGEIDDLIGSMAIDADQRNGSGVKTIGEVAIELMEQIEHRYENQDKLSGIPTGFTELDGAFDGMQQGDFIILAGRPGMGKTAFAGAIARYAAQVSHVHKIPLEMTSKALVRRHLVAEGQTEGWRLRTGKLQAEHFDDITATLGTLSQLKLTYEDKPLSKLPNVISAIKRAVRKGAKLIIIDNLNLISTPSQSRAQELSEVTGALKNLTLTLNVTIILICHLNRECEKRPDKRPQLSDLKDSGSIEQDADIVMFLYREGYYKNPKEISGEAEVILAKGRDIPTPTVKLFWDGPRTRFTNP